jgi:hypothetical protein
MSKKNQIIIIVFLILAIAVIFFMIIQKYNEFSDKDPSIITSETTKDGSGGDETKKPDETEKKNRINLIDDENIINIDYEKDDLVLERLFRTNLNPNDVQNKEAEDIIIRQTMAGSVFGKFEGDIIITGTYDRETQFLSDYILSTIDIVDLNDDGIFDLFIRYYKSKSIFMVYDYKWNKVYEYKFNDNIKSFLYEFEVNKIGNKAVLMNKVRDFEIELEEVKINEDISYSFKIDEEVKPELIEKSEHGAHLRVPAKIINDNDNEDIKDLYIIYDFDNDMKPYTKGFQYKDKYIELE